MKIFITYVIIGIADGSIYSIAGLGLVLTFKTSGIFNFAFGAQAAGAAYLMYTFRTQHGMPWPLAALLAVLLAGVLGGLILERLANVLSGESTAIKIVAMVGILVGLDAVLTSVYGSATLPFEAFLPTHLIRIGGVNVTEFQIIVTALALVAAGVLYMMFRTARIGTAMQAVVDDPALLDILGTSPSRVRRFSWIVGSTFAAISGLLLATFLGLDVNDLTLLVIFSFGAAAVGAFSNLPLTYLGGLAIGIGQSITQGYLGNHQAFQQLPSNVPFIVLVVALLVIPPNRLVERGARATRIESPPTPTRRSTAVAGGGVLVAALCVLPFVVGFHLTIWTTGLAFVVIFVSLSLLAQTSGQVSLCQMTFAAVGSATFATLANHHVPWGIALLLGAFAAVPIGILVAIPAIRLRGVYLAVVTLGFGILVERVFFPTFLMFGATDSLSVPRPRWGFINFTSDRAYYFLTLLITLMVCGLVVLVRRGRLGRLLLALSESPPLLRSNGVNANLTKMLVFCLSAFLAGIGGALLGGVTQTTGGPTFDFSISLIMIAVLFVSGRRPVLSAFIAAGLYVVAVSYISNPTVQNYSGVVFGAAVVIVATRIIPIGVRRVGRGIRASQRLDERTPNSWLGPVEAGTA
ncbi:MAG TPA: ABC transporter permease [Acidimicrobiales bacterium]|jgi:branched-subunit amino acid ABC-type transport system permease component|nr:ABC transporter permease [Acidimicrobiales bacterium]